MKRFTFGAKPVCSLGDYSWIGAQESFLGPCWSNPGLLRGKNVLGLWPGRLQFCIIFTCVLIDKIKGSNNFYLVCGKFEVFPRVVTYFEHDNF